MSSLRSVAARLLGHTFEGVFVVGICLQDAFDFLLRGGFAESEGVSSHVSDGGGIVSTFAVGGWLCFLLRQSSIDEWLCPPPATEFFDALAVLTGKIKP